MQKYQQAMHIFLAIVLAFFASNCFAIQVHVQSSSQQVSALGFTVNGKNYGAAGSSYSKNNAPSGVYTFGIRINGIFGKDVGCKTSDGKNQVTLNADTTAILDYNGKQCVLNLSSRK